MVCNKMNKIENYLKDCNILGYYKSNDELHISLNCNSDVDEIIGNILGIDDKCEIEINSKYKLIVRNRKWI